MSIQNHPNLHVVDLMLRIHHAIDETLRGKGMKLTVAQRLVIAKDLAEKAEEIVDELVGE